MKIKRAAILVALFFISSRSFAQTATTTETYKDIIEKSYTLSLQDDRKQALHLLFSALKKEKRQIAIKELSTALIQVGSRFYSDKNQQAYEVALTSFFDDPATSQAKMSELEKTDPSHTEVLKALVLLQLRQGSCGGAAVEMAKIVDFIPYAEDVRLLQAKTFLCAGDLTAASKYAMAADLKKGKLAAFWLSTLMEITFRRGQFAKTLEYARQATKLSPDFPESNYWSWKAQNETATAQKYLAQCRGLNPRLKRQFLLEPMLCSRLSEVETFLKKSDNPGL